MQGNCNYSNRILSKTLFIVPLPPPVHGSTVMCQYIKESKLINEKFDCDYVNLSASRTMAEVHKFQLVKIWRMLLSYLIVLWKLITKRYDLCYVALAFHKSLLKDVPMVFLCKLFRRKVVIHLHGKGALEDAKSVFYHWLLKKTFKNTKVILLSWLLYPDVKEFVKKEDVMICPNGIPPVEYSPRNKDNVVPRLLFLSNLIVSKGVIVLLDALKILKDRGCSFICDFVGGETAEIDAAKFQKEVEKRGLNELAIYSGKKYGNEKNECFSQADVFVLPTMNDCFPLVILEAMSCEKPVVTTAIGGVPDIVEDEKTGLIADAGDYKSLASKLEILINNRELISSYGMEGKKKFHEQFSKEAFEACLNNALNAAAGGVNIALCRYLGKQYGEDKDRIFCQSDIFVFPTFYENECFPLVVLEAMQHGLGIITTTEGALADIVKNKENGLTVSKRDSMELADAMHILVNDKEFRRRVSRKVYQQYKDKYTITAFEGCLCKCLNKILENPN